MTQKLTPNQTAPALTVPTVNGQTWTLTDQTPPNYTMIVFSIGDSIVRFVKLIWRT